MNTDNANKNELLKTVAWPNFAKRNGLIDIVVQCGVTQDVLMVAYANEEAYRKTLQTGKAHFYSTARKKLWMKGEESGNVMDVIDAYIDCDGDAGVYVVVLKGASRACHTDARTCFYRSGIGRDLGIPAPNAGEKEALQSMEVELHPSLARFAGVRGPPDIYPIIWSLDNLEHTLRKRAKASAKVSYTSKLLKRGSAKCAQKLAEEAAEAAIAAVCQSKGRLVSECADVVYHMLVLLLSRGLSFADVKAELLRREGTSGLVEKSSRKK